MITNLNIPLLHGAGGCVEGGLFKSNSASTSKKMQDFKYKSSGQLIVPDH
jgi:hypothetical protein